jgi:hypothetical protein
MKLEYVERNAGEIDKEDENEGKQERNGQRVDDCSI